VVSLWSVVYFSFSSQLKKSRRIVVISANVSIVGNEPQGRGCCSIHMITFLLIVIFNIIQYK
jgi:hypothetical protein